MLDFRAGYLSVVPNSAQQPLTENQTPDVTQAIRDQLATLMTPELPDHIAHEEEIMAAPPAPVDMPPEVPVAPVNKVN